MNVQNFITLYNHQSMRPVYWRLKIYIIFKHHVWREMRLYHGSPNRMYASLFLCRINENIRVILT